MWRLRIGLLAALIGSLWVAVTPALAQTGASTGSICALAFNDLARSGVHSASDPILSGVNVTLAVDNGLMIGNHLSDEAGQYCFTNLTPGHYRLTFSDPLAQPTTPTNLALTLNAGDQLINLFGAVPDAAPTSSSTAVVTSTRGVVFPLTRSGRLLLATGGAGGVMTFLIALGLIALGLRGIRQISAQRAVDRPPPDARAGSDDSMRG